MLRHVLFLVFVATCAREANAAGDTCELVFHVPRSSICISNTSRPFRAVRVLVPGGCPAGGPYESLLISPAFSAELAIGPKNHFDVTAAVQWQQSLRLAKPGISMALHVHRLANAADDDVHYSLFLDGGLRVTGARDPHGRLPILELEGYITPGNLPPQAQAPYLHRCLVIFPL